MEEEGYTKFPNDLQKAIQSNKFNGSEMAVLMCVIRLTLGYNLKEREITCRQISEMTGLFLRGVERAFSALKRRRILLCCSSDKNNKLIYSINFNFSEWSSPVKNDGTSPVKNDGTSSYYIKDNSFKDNFLKTTTTKDNLLKTTTTQKTAVVFGKLILISGTEKREPNRHESELLEKWVADGFTDEEILTAFVKAKEQGMRDELNLSYIDKVLTAKKTKIEKTKSAPAMPPSYDLDRAERMSRTGIPKLKKKEKR